MRAYRLLAPAKINLYLQIVGSRPDGYHELAMILQSIDLADRLDLRATGTDEIRVLCDHPQVPADRSNLAYRAAALMVDRFPDSFRKYGGVEITIQKQIPVGAGLAGGSTNAAAVLVGINLMWRLGLTQSELQELGAELGSDVPFCVAGGTAIATGRGEQLSPLPGLDNLYIILGKHRSLSVSTPWAYQTYRQQFSGSYVANDDLEGRKQRVHSGAIVAAITQRDTAQIGKLLSNDLEKVVLPAHPKVAELRSHLQRLETLGAMMSGSGPSVFGLIGSQAEAAQMRDRLQVALPDPDLDFWVTKFISTGIQVVA